MMDIYTKRQNKAISDIIFLLRKEKNLTYSELEELTGVSRSVLYRIEHGETKRPGYGTVKAIAGAFPAHYKEIMEYYIQEEERIDILFEILGEIVNLEDHSSLVSMVALQILRSPQGKTEDTLQRLYDFTGKISDSALKVILYKAIIKYSREHGVMNYIAKGLLQKHLIERLDIKRLEQSYQDGQEILNYTNFLSFEEQITLYLRMGLLAYAVKKFEDCIQFCQTGIVMERKDTELKARAHLAMINSYSQLKNYDKVEELLDVFEKYKYDFVNEAAKISRAIVKARKGEYDIAVPLLENYLEELSQQYRLHIIDELFEIYLKLDDLNACAKLLERECEMLGAIPELPHTYNSIGKYYQHKGYYFVNIGLIDEGIKSFSTSLQYLTKINAFQEKDIYVFLMFIQNSLILNQGLYKSYNIDDPKSLYN